MSAYVSDREGQVIALHPYEPTQDRARAPTQQAPTQIPTNETQPSRVIAEIEAILARSRSLETALQEEQKRGRDVSDAARKDKERFDQLQSEHSRLLAAFNKNLQHFELNYSRFNQLKATYLGEKSRRQQLEGQVELNKREIDQLQRGQGDLEALKNELFQIQRSEKNLKFELSSYLDQIKTLSEERRRLELERKSSQLENDLQKSMSDQRREQEKFLRESLESIQSKHEAALSEGLKLRDQNQFLLNKLHEFKAAWTALNHRERALSQRLSSLKNQEIESTDLRRLLDEERAMRRNLEEQVSKTKREKDLALKILTEAETKLVSVSKELELSKEKSHSTKSSSTLHLEF